MRSLIQRAYFPALATLMGGLVATIAGTWLTSQVCRQRDQDRFAEEADQMARTIERDFQRLNSVLLDLRDRLPRPLTLANLPGSGDLVHLVPADLTNRISGIGVALMVSPTNLVSWTEALRTRFQTNLQIFPSGPPAGLFHVHDPGESNSYRVERAYLPVAEVATWSTAEHCDCGNFTLGADLFRSGNPEEMQAAAIVSVIADGTAVTIGRGISDHEPVASSDALAGRFQQTFISIAPIYRGGSTGTMQNTPERFDDTSGLLFLFVDANAVVELASAPWRGQLLVEAETGHIESGRRVDVAPLIKKATPGVPAYQAAELDVVVGVSQIFLSIRSLPRWDWAAGRSYPPATAGVGAVLSMLAASWVARQIRRSLDSEAEASELRTANAAMAAARETRSFITRELHDNTLQNLYVLSLELAQTRARLRESPEEAANALDLGLEEVRRISADLRGFLVSDTQSAAALGAEQVFTAIVERVRRGTQTVIRLDLDPKAIPRLGARCSAELSQILREALSNALRHGQPREISVELKVSGAGGWALAIVDDGCGFDLGAPSSGKGQGRQNMLRRCELMEATLEISSQPGQGTRVVVTFGVADSGSEASNPRNS